MKTIAITNQKGSCGKMTTAVNLASAEYVALAEEMISCRIPSEQTLQQQSFCLETVNGRA